ncbi:MAG TPA: CheR family methyltransferase, partial [Burkholderiales bacterium]|nr:CheR family methyltransferase [Burkholderiales bacterium]
ALDDLPCDLAARFLQPIPDPSAPCYRVREDVRYRVLFSRYDVSGEASLPPGAPFDLVAFRNVAIYFRREVHEDVFARVASALRPGGYLCLGEAEWPPASLERHLYCAVRQLRLFRGGCAVGAEAA